MTREALIKRALNNIAKLLDQNLIQVLDYPQFLLKQIQDRMLTSGIQNLASNSDYSKFLESKPEVYSVSDLKVRYK